MCEAVHLCIESPSPGCLLAAPYWPPWPPWCSLQSGKGIWRPLLRQQVALPHSGAVWVYALGLTHTSPERLSLKNTALQLTFICWASSGHSSWTGQRSGGQLHQHGALVGRLGAQLLVNAGHGIQERASANHIHSGYSWSERGAQNRAGATNMSLCCKSWD